MSIQDRIRTHDSLCSNLVYGVVIPQGVWSEEPGGWMGRGGDELWAHPAQTEAATLVWKMQVWSQIPLGRVCRELLEAYRHVELRVSGTVLLSLRCNPHYLDVYWQGGPPLFKCQYRDTIIPSTRIAPPVSSCKCWRFSSLCFSSKNSTVHLSSAYVDSWGGGLRIIKTGRYADTDLQDLTYAIVIIIKPWIEDFETYLV